MTNQNKLIVGGVVVVLLGYYFYNKNKVKNEVLELKNGAKMTIAKLDKNAVPFLTPKKGED